MKDLPDDLVCNIASKLSPKDILNLRKVSKYFAAATCTRQIWINVYERSTLIHSRIPITSQSTRELERVLIKAEKLHDNWTCSRPKVTRDVISKVELQGHFLIVIHGRFLLVSPLQGSLDMRCYRLSRLHGSLKYELVTTYQGVGGIAICDASALRDSMSKTVDIAVRNPEIIREFTLLTLHLEEPDNIRFEHKRTIDLGPDTSDDIEFALFSWDILVINQVSRGEFWLLHVPTRRILKYTGVFALRSSMMYTTKYFTTSTHLLVVAATYGTPDRIVAYPLPSEEVWDRGEDIMTPSHIGDFGMTIIRFPHVMADFSYSSEGDAPGDVGVKMLTWISQHPTPGISLEVITLTLPTSTESQTPGKISLRRAPKRSRIVNIVSLPSVVLRCCTANGVTRAIYVNDSDESSSEVSIMGCTFTPREMKDPKQGPRYHIVGRPLLRMNKEKFIKYGLGLQLEGDGEIIDMEGEDEVEMWQL